VRKAALVCEAITDVASVAFGAASVLKIARAAEIAQMTGIEAKTANFVLGISKPRVLTGAADLKKVDDFVESARSAQRATAGAGGRFTDKAAQDSLLAVSGSMNADERILAFEKLTNRAAPLTQREADQLVKMHDVGTNEGRTFSNLTKADKDKKIQLAQEINPDSGKPYFSQEDIQVAMRNGITGSSDKIQGTMNGKSASQYYGEKAATENYSQYDRLHAESLKAEGDLVGATKAYGKAYDKFATEKGRNVASEVQKDGTTKVQIVTENLATKMSENELIELRNLAKSSGNTSQLPDIEKAIAEKIAARPKATVRGQRIDRP
jgi:hypothetical protein